VVKVATYRGNGHWTYVTSVSPSAPVVDAALAQQSDPAACTAGVLLRPVASFVLTWPDGHQIRYKRIGNEARCR
jgi:hypothetical protein